MISDRFKNDGVSVLKLNKLQKEKRDQLLLKLQSGRYKTESVSCPVCEKNDFETLAEKDRYGVPQVAVVCSHCGLVQSRPRMTQSACDEFYNEEYRQLYGDYVKPNEKFFLNQVKNGERIYAMIMENAPLLMNEEKERLVVEVGCGAGGNLYPFVKKGFKAVGFDLGREYIDFGRDAFGLDLQYGDFDLEKLPKKADVIIYNHVLEHVLDVTNELQLVHDALEDDGIVYICVPSVKWLHNSYAMDFLRLLQSAHVWHFTQRSLSNLCKKVGFSSVSSDERVRMVLKKSQPDSSFESDYKDVMEYLFWIEKDRQRLKNKLVVLLQDQNLPMRKCLAKLVSQLGLKRCLEKMIYNRKIQEKAE